MHSDGDWQTWWPQYIQGRRLQNSVRLCVAVIEMMVWYLALVAGLAKEKPILPVSSSNWGCKSTLDHGDGDAEK